MNTRSENAKAATADDLSRKPWKPKPAPRWRTSASGRVYRPTMKLMHRLGFCYPERSYVTDTAVWCHWCGMRGSIVRTPAAVSEGTPQSEVNNK